MEPDKTRYNIEGLAEDLGVDFEDLAPLYSSYFSEMKSEIEAMKEYVAKSDWNMLQRITHNIKGVSANLYVNDVFDEASTLNNMLKEGNNPVAEIYIGTIESLLKSAESEIREFFIKKGYKI